MVIFLMEFILTNLSLAVFQFLSLFSLENTMFDRSNIRNDLINAVPNHHLPTLNLFIRFRDVNIIRIEDPSCKNRGNCSKYS
jgi:hypothetical protein